MPAVLFDAIVNTIGQDYIFITYSLKKTTGDSLFYFKKYPVSKGASDVGFTEIIPVNPIPAGSWIVIKGAFFVLAKATNKGKEE